MSCFIGVDTGGTFTDIVLIEADGEIVFDKAFSTPRNPAEGVLQGLANCAARAARPLEAVLRETERFAHGTTVGTNALIQRRGARTGLLMTRGFEDTPFITRGPMGKNLGIPPSRAMDFVHNERPQPLVPKHLVRGVTERVASDGAVVAELREAEAEEAVASLVAAGVESLAVCLLWSFRNPDHERRLLRLAQRVAPQIPVSLSVDVAPVLGEFERTATTCVNAFVGPVLVRYIRDLQERLAGMGLGRPLQLMTCSGGVTLPQHVERQAVSLINSGPVGGLVAAAHLGQALGCRNLITTDMGGTSFDVGLIHEGEMRYEPTTFLDQGLPAQVPAVRVDTIGAGGGSIAWTDGQRLLVGPQSAGSDPGPACYGLGGEEPTVTDALVVLGLLDPEYFFGGRKRLLRERAEAALRTRVAEPLGLDVREAAAGVYEIVTAKMADLIRKATVESGHDPREFVVLAYGGASAAHAALYAQPLAVREVIVPRAASVFSALGCALSDVKYLYAHSQPLLLDADPATAAAYESTFRTLEERARADMQASGFDPAEARCTRRLDLRYEGQMSEITIPVDEPTLGAEGVGRIRAAFEQTYESRFGRGTSRAESALEVMTFRLEALRPTVKPSLRAEPEGPPDPAAARKGERAIYLRGFGPLQAQVYDGERLRPGHRVAGPAIVERPDTTVLVPPGHAARVDGHLNLRLTVAEA